MTGQLKPFEFTYRVEMRIGRMWVRAYNIGCPPSLFRQLLDYQQSMLRNVRLKRTDAEPDFRFSDHLKVLEWLKSARKS